MAEGERIAGRLEDTSRTDAMARGDTPLMSSPGLCPPRAGPPRGRCAPTRPVEAPLP
jgi:hypothetical protein